MNRRNFLAHLGLLSSLSLAPRSLLALESQSQSTYDLFKNSLPNHPELIGYQNYTQQRVVDELVNEGQYPKEFNGQLFKDSENIDSLPQIVHEIKDIDVSSFWGQDDMCDVGITRVDFDLSDESPTEENLILDADLVMGTGLAAGSSSDVTQDFGYAAASEIDVELPFEPIAKIDDATDILPPLRTPVP